VVRQHDPLSRMNFRFRGKSGHAADITAVTEFVKSQNIYAKRLGVGPRRGRENHAGRLRERAMPHARWRAGVWRN
jgi:hypothetical protein